MHNTSPLGICYVSLIVQNHALMKSNYKKIFTGDSLLAKRLAGKLHEIGIEAVVKDEAESARLAGFASSMLGQVDVYVHKDEIEKATLLVESHSKKSQD